LQKAHLQREEGFLQSTVAVADICTTIDSQFIIQVMVD